VIGEAATAEMALTGADYDATWALDNGLVSRVSEDGDAVLTAAWELAETISANSPLVTAGIKTVLRAGRGRTVEEGLEFVARWNSSHLLSDDLTEAITAFMGGRSPEFKGE
jgi:enoyl-CoA hydratase